MLDQKRVVKFGISLIAVACIGLGVTTKSEKKITKTIKTNSINKEIKKTQAIKKLTKTQKKCLGLKKTIAQELSTNEVPRSWSNYHLSKDGIEYVLRIEKDNNTQGYEVERIKFYKLDSDGFPEAYSDNHNEILKDKAHLDQLKEGYEVIQKDEVYVSHNILIEKTDGEIALIKDQATSETCEFNS